MKLCILRLLNKKFRVFEKEHNQLVFTNPEAFYRDGERNFTTKELKWLEFLTEKNTVKKREVF